MSERTHLPPQENAIALLEHPTPPTQETVPQGVTVAEAVEATLDHRGIAAPLVASEVNMTGGGDSRAMTRRERFYRSRTGRLVMSSLAALGLASTGVVVDASPALANPVYTVVNPDNDGTRSIYDRNSPRMADTTRTYPDFSYYGDRLELICGTNGEAVGPKNNKRWHYAKNLSRPEAGVTWIPDRYMNSPNKANQPTPGEAECGSTPSGGGEASKPAPAVTACYFNMKAPSKNLTFSYEGDHRYLGNAYQAAKNWSNAGAGININHTTASNAYIRFKDVYSSGDFFAHAVIPETPEWMGPYKTPPKNPKRPSYIVIEMNQRTLDMQGIGDFQRTYAAGHEIGHTLGAAHPELCEDYSSTGLMNKGSLEELKSRKFNTPMPYDKNVIKQLYQ